MKNYYEILEVEATATQEQVVASYKRLIKIWHPDVNKATDAIDRTKELNKSYQTLSDPIKRQQYDRERAPSDPFERNVDSNPQGMRVTWTQRGNRGFNQTVVIIGDQVWINGVRVQ